MPKNDPFSTRRDFLKTTGGIAAAVALPSFARSVHIQGSNTIQIACVGCGGRGTGAIANALSTKQGPTKLVAMADAFPDRLQSSFKNLTNGFQGQVDVPLDRQFLGLDSYKKAMDCLRPGDVVILTTPPAFRCIHFEYAISKKLNVFMEKPVTVDGPQSKRMLNLGKMASAAGLKVGVGLMSRHMVGIQELQKRVMDGEIGDVIYMRGYRMHGPAATFDSVAKPENISHIEYQIRRFHSFLWASGGCYSDFYIHHIDHLSWMKDSWPVNAQALGGRHYEKSRDGQQFVDQNFDNYAVEYTFEDGTKFFFDGRCVEGANGIYSSYVHGTKGCAVVARSGDYGGPAAIFKGQKPQGTPVWEATDRSNPYQNEWEVLMQRIRSNTPHNEVKTGVDASLTSSMGRMAAHTAQFITMDQMLNCPHEFAPGLDKLTLASDAPLMPDASGRYPIPRPGIVIDREF